MYQIPFNVEIEYTFCNTEHIIDGRNLPTACGDKVTLKTLCCGHEQFSTLTYCTACSRGNAIVAFVYPTKDPDSGKYLAQIPILGTIVYEPKAMQLYEKHIEYIHVQYYQASYGAGWGGRHTSCTR